MALCTSKTSFPAYCLFGKKQEKYTTGYKMSRPLVSDFSLLSSHIGH